LDENHIFWEKFENFQPYPKDTILALSTFGRPAVFHAIYLKIVGCNILRASVHAKMREIASKMANMPTFGLYSAFFRMCNASIILIAARLLPDRVAVEYA